jgi:hypothetical protein
MTVVEQIYDFFEQHDEREFLNYLREHKTHFLELEKKQSNTTLKVEKQIASFKVSTLDTKS